MQISLILLLPLVLSKEDLIYIYRRRIKNVHYISYL